MVVQRAGVVVGKVRGEAQVRVATPCRASCRRGGGRRAARRRYLRGEEEGERVCV